MNTIDALEGGCAQSAVKTMSDQEVVDQVVRSAARERHATADLIRVLIEFDRRRLYLGQGCSSLFVYCTEVLHYSEHGAFNRIEVARAAARWPQLLACIEDGSLHLAGARLLAPHLTEENLEMALACSRHKSKRDIEEVAAGLARRNLIAAVEAARYRLHLTISREARDNLRQVLALVSHRLPDADPSTIFEQALAVLLEKLQRERLGPTPPPPSQPPSAPPATRSRHIPKAVQRAVWARDGGRCAYVGASGRCSQTHRVQLHHLHPFAAGGPSTESNLELRCQAHNAYEAERFFGEEVMAAARQSRQRSSSAGATVAGQASGEGTATRPGTTRPDP